MNAQAHLTRVVRDNAGRIHRPGEQVTVVGKWYELGTHRSLLRAQWDNGEKTLLLPEDVDLS